jgi:hypothetical protein
MCLGIVLSIMAVPGMSIMAAIGSVASLARMFDIVVVTIQAKHAFHATDNATYGCPHNSAHRAGDATPFVKTVSCTARNTTLSLSGDRQGHHREPCSTDQ